MTILIRPARLSDAQDMIDVLNPLIREGGTTAMPKELTLAEQEVFLSALAPRDACHVAVDGEDVVGYQSIEVHPALPPHIADIATFVRIGEKGRGVGSRLSAASFAAAAANGFTEINATIRADNFEGLAFYTKVGFRDHSVVRAKLLATGKLVDRVSKRRPL